MPSPFSVLSAGLVSRVFLCSMKVMFVGIIVVYLYFFLFISVLKYFSLFIVKFGVVLISIFNDAIRYILSYDTLRRYLHVTTFN